MPDIREHIRHSNLIEKIDDQAEIDQSLVAWRMLEATPIAAIGHEVVKAVQKIVVAHQTNLGPDQRGEYRDVSEWTVSVGQFHPPRYSRVPSLMDDWLRRYPHVTPLKEHIDFERYHPFVDGNGRAGRLLMWRHELELGQSPTLISVSDKWKYYRVIDNDQAAAIAARIGLAAYLTR